MKISRIGERVDLAKIDVHFFSVFIKYKCSLYIYIGHFPYECAFSKSSRMVKTWVTCKSINVLSFIHFSRHQNYLFLTSSFHTSIFYISWFWYLDPINLVLGLKAGRLLFRKFFLVFVICKCGQMKLEFTMILFCVLILGSKQRNQEVTLWTQGLRTTLNSFFKGYKI